MVNYAKPLPVDREGGKMVGSPPAFPALASTTRENIAASSVTSLNANTTVVAVSAVSAPVAIKWANNQATSVVSAASGANYDYVVEKDKTQILVVPRSSAAVPSIVGYIVREGLYTGIATIGGAVGSVFLAEY